MPYPRHDVLPPEAHLAMRIYDKFEAHQARDEKLRGAVARIAEDQKVGWPFIAATAVIGVLTTLLLAYVALRAWVPVELIGRR